MSAVGLSFCPCLPHVHLASQRLLCRRSLLGVWDEQHPGPRDPFVWSPRNIIAIAAACVVRAGCQCMQLLTASACSTSEQIAHGNVFLQLKDSNQLVFMLHAHIQAETPLSVCSVRYWLTLLVLVADPFMCLCSTWWWASACKSALACHTQLWQPVQLQAPCTASPTLALITQTGRWLTWMWRSSSYLPCYLVSV